jgi:hypothetical protein
MRASVDEHMFDYQRSLRTASSPIGTALGYGCRAKMAELQGQTRKMEAKMTATTDDGASRSFC